MAFFKVFIHLLPTGKAWRIVIEKQLREFFEGLSGIGQDGRDFLDNIFRDIDPQTTRELPQWEQQFALRDTGLTDQERRDRLEGSWSALGGQDPAYLQATLQAAGFDVFVHEWWEPIGGRPAGGSVDSDVTPVARNPFTYLDDDPSGNTFLMFDGGADAQDGDTVSQDGGKSAPQGYSLVNKIVTTSFIADGAADMQDGDPKAQDGGIDNLFARKIYQMPADVTKYPFFLYIGGETFPNQAGVPNSRRDEFEDLCLKICPTEQWLGILVTYS